MDFATIVIIAFAIVLSAIGVTVAFRLVPLSRRVTRDLKSIPSGAGNKADQKRMRSLEHPAGRRRDSSIMDLVGNLIRHTDGGFTKAYHVTLDHTIFTDEHLIERRIDERVGAAVEDAQRARAVDAGRAADSVRVDPHQPDHGR